MKKIFIVMAMGIAIACNSGSDEKKPGNDADTPKTEDSASTSGLPSGISQEEYDKALQLIAGSDCLTCHQIEQKTTGPAYREVANKYESTDANIAMLADKIMKGGTGNWGAVPMTPHPDINEADAKVMAKYILSLKNNK